MSSSQPIPSIARTLDLLVPAGIRSGRRVTPFLVGTLSALPSISV